ncbi:MAG TPA: cytochrome o ubiquinol oxidase subunit III [Verrucomicrobiae bacterium]|nr:cytochrome o ubiquinol oxidase subunit III [Verrucomicrobiae bacterium]
MPTHTLIHPQHGGVSPESDAKTVFGFWVYLMTDLVLFATLFATYAVLRNNTYGGEAGHELFQLPFVLTETLILLTSSFTCGLAMLAHRTNNRQQTLAWLAVTLLLGLSFLTMEVTEFHKLIGEGNGYQRSAFLSSFFTLIGTHGLHITVGCLWIIALMVETLMRGLNARSVSKFLAFSLFWHFLDIVWIFIFTIVYLMGAM